MASEESLEENESKQKLVEKSSTAISGKRNWFSTRWKFLGFMAPKEDDSTRRQVKRRFLFEMGEVDEDGQVVLASDDFMTPEENINDIVDQDETDLENVISGRLLPDFLLSIWFRMAVYLSIIFNAIVLGLETSDWFVEEYAVFTQVVKELTLAFFVSEILLKWYCGFWIFWRNNWNIIDFVIVGLAVIGPAFRYVSCGRILRLFRACFMFRAVATIDKFGILKGLTAIVESLLISLPDMIHIALIMLLILLVMAIAANNLLREDLPHWYGDLGSAFFSLFILTTQDGLVIQYKDFEEESLWIRSVGAIFYVLAILAGAFIFVNIIVAISCYNLEVACKAAEGEEEEDEDEEKKAVPKDLTDDPSDDPTAELLDKFQFISKNKALKGLGLFQLQKPFQLTNFSYLTVAKLEKYLLVLSALEENLAEYEDIKRDLEELYDLVKNLNLLDVVHESRASLQAEGAALRRGSKGSKGSDQDMKHFTDMLKRSTQRNQGITSSRTTEETSGRASASSEGSQGRRRLAPSDALHPATKK